MSGENSGKKLISAPMSPLLLFFLSTTAIIFRMSAIVLAIVPALFFALLFPRLVWFEMFTLVTIAILTIVPVLFIPDCPDLFVVVTT